MRDWSDHFAPRASRMAASEIRELLKLLDQPDIISFAGGIPDPALFPREHLAAAFDRVLGDPRRAETALQYSVSEGHPPLREWIAGYMGRLGVRCAADNVIITNGSQQALDFLGKLCIAPDDRVLVAWPTYLGALQAFNCYQPIYDVLPGPDSNRTVASYREGPGGAPKLGYVMPEFQNPTGTSLDRAAREALLDVADALDLLLIEDAAYEKLRYDGVRAPSLMQLSIERAGHIDDARVVYCGTFSKTVVPALRIGWAVAPRSIVQKLVLIKQASDLHVATLNQMVMLEVAAEVIEPHAIEIRKTYKARRDAMLDALARHMPPGVEWTRPEGGMFIWVTLPAHHDGAKLLERAVREARVAFVPGEAFFADRSQRNHIRLSFSRADTASIEEGIGRLGRLLKAH
jgi:DNA-binding transcriptional MocR family regulator